MNFDRSSHRDLSPAPPATPNNPQLVHHQGGGSQAFRWYRKPIKGERNQWVSMARGLLGHMIRFFLHLQSRVLTVTCLAGLMMDTLAGIEVVSISITDCLEYWQTVH